MSLGTRLTLKTAVLVAAVLVVAGVALWGLGGLNRDLDQALGEYDRLREAYTLMSSIEQARTAARDVGRDVDRTERALMRPLLWLDDREAGGSLSDELCAALRDDLGRSLAALHAPQEGEGDTTLRVVGPINTAINRLYAEIDDTSARIQQIERRADDHRTRVVTWVALTASAGALLAIAVGVWQYLAVMRPLRRLGRGVNRLASGDFADRLAAAGDREFALLAGDFNRMADELSTLYRDLEAKVRLRSAQLAQSERLASVGFLAAGVAHEINNPLAIIAGEAELALRGLPDDAAAPARDALTVIHDEAFRCKQITQKLLSLARPGSGKREPVELRRLVEEVINLVRTLPQHERRSLRATDGGDVTANTDAAQLKQVLLNLAINALEAVDPGPGSVVIDIGWAEDRPVIQVIDNGKGIDPAALGRVFEPFYTEKKTPATPGLGLGLSISHAIVEDLGGRLTAASEGAGRGSVFTIELPATIGGTTA